MYKYLEEKAKAKGKILLVESCQIRIAPENVEIFEKAKLIESKSGNFEARGVIKNVPITGYELNENKRKYIRPLWERVQKLKVAEGTTSLTDHPDDDGSVEKICGVWHNFEAKEKGGYADWYLTGSKGQDLLEHLKAGARIGISTVGFGEFEEDGQTVKVETYELERLGDAVMNPSQHTFAEFDFKNSENSENKELNERIIEKNFTNSIENKKVRVYEMSDAIKLQEANYKNQIKNAIKLAEENSNINEGIKTLQGLEVPDGMPEISSLIESKITFLHEKMEEQIEVEKIEKENLKENYEELKTEHETLKEKYDKLIMIADKAGIKESDEGFNTTSEEVVSLKESKEFLEKEVLFLKEDISNMEDDLNCYEEDTEARDDDIKCFMEDRKLMQEDIDFLVNKLKTHERRIVIYEKMLEDYGYEFDEFDDEDDYINDSYIDDDDDDDYIFEAKKKKAKKKKAKKTEEADEELDEEEDDKADDKADEEKPEEKEKKKEAIASYIKGEIKRFPALSSIKEKVKRCSSIIQAVDMVQAFKEDRTDGHFKFDESIESKFDDDDFIGDRL